MDVYHSQTYYEKITLKVIKPDSINELNSIKDFLLNKINTALMCIDFESYKEVMDIEIIII